MDTRYIHIIIIYLDVLLYYICFLKWRIDSVFFSSDEIWIRRVKEGGIEVKWYGYTYYVRRYVCICNIKKKKIEGISYLCLIIRIKTKEVKKPFLLLKAS